MASPSDFPRRAAFAQMPSHRLSKPRLSQAPQHNPYDKFTQDEFDAWIGGITGALRRALGQEDEVVSPHVTSSHYSEQSNSSDEEEVQRLVEFPDESSGEESEASFSSSTARRISKGKARDPRDGPGFGRGHQNEPIFIDSDSDEDEEDEEAGEAEDGEDGEEDEAIEEWDSQSEEDDDKRDIGLAEAESSVQARIRREKQEFVEEDEDEDEDEEGEEFGGDEQQGEDDENKYDAPSPGQSSSPVLFVDSDEELEIHDMTSQGSVPDDITERFDEDDANSPLSTSIRIGPPRHRAKQRHVFVAEARDLGVENYEDIQPSVNDTSFPPHETISQAKEDESIELPDRWAGPETYAEDYYSGGDVKESHSSAADILGMEYDEWQQATTTGDPSLSPPSQRSVEQYNEVAQAQDVIQLDVDEIQPLTEDTYNHFSFMSHQPVEIPDPWVGPKTYAEDFYSGGDVRPLQNVALDPHRIGANDQSEAMISMPEHEVIRSQEEIPHVDEVELGDAQPSPNVGAADSSSNGIDESPRLDYTIELPEPWDGSIVYEEDYPAQAEIKSSPHIAENQSGVRNDGDIEVVVGFEDETAPVKSQDATASSKDDAAKLTQEHFEGEAEQVLDRIEHLATSRHDDPLGRIALAQAEGSDFLYDDIPVPENDEGQDQDDAPVLDWINDSAFIHDMPAINIADVKWSDLDSSADASMEVVGSNKEAVDKIGGNLDQGTSGPAQLLTATMSAEKMTDALHHISSETEGGLENTPEAGKVEIQLPSAPMCPTEVIEDGSHAEHDKEPEIRNPLTLARDEAETGDKIEVDVDFVLKEDLVAPEIREVEETDVKLNFGASEKLLEPDADLEVQHKSTIASHVEVPDGDPAILVDAASKESNFENSELTTVTVDLDKPALTPPKPELIMSRSTTPTLIEGLQSLNGDANKSASIDTDLTTHTFPTNTSHSQSSDPIVAPRSSLRVSELSEEMPQRAPDITPSVSETFQTESTSKQEIRLDCLMGQGTISDSGIDPASSDQQQLLSSSPGSALFPYPALPCIGPYTTNVVMRKASEPFLFADPYPASLSTPHDTNSGYSMSFGHFFTGELSPSSYDVPEGSTTRRNVVNDVMDDRIENQIPATDNPAQITDVQPNEAACVQQDDSVEMELVSDAHPISAATALSPLPTSKSSVAAQDTESNGEVSFSQDDDLTKVEVARDIVSAPPSKELDKSLELNSPADTALTVRESVAEDDGDENPAQQLSPLSSPAADGPSTSRVRSPPLEDDLPSILIVKKVQADDQTPVKAKAGRPQKRKRSSSTTMMSPLPRTGSLKKTDKNKVASHFPAKLRVPNRKVLNGKSNEAGVSPISQGSRDRRSVSSRSSSDASAARRMLDSSSRGTSRASSIASTTPSDNQITQPSPTLGRSSSLRHQPLQLPPPPVPLLHRHHHNRPQQSHMNQRASSSVKHDPAESSTSKQSTSSLHRHTTFSSSPVTRSNCRYHKISIPLDDESDEEGSGDEDVKLVYFLVPGCSLGNKELNRDEKIIDHGDAQPSDGLLMTSDLDAYAFNAPLLSVLRLLVGVDMLREGEIYYLPLPGSDWVPRKVRETSGKIHQISVDHVPSHATPRRNPSMSASSVSIAPVASHGPASTTLGSLRPLKPPSAISQTSSELTDVEDSPRLKRFRFSSVGEQDNVSELEPESGSRLRKPKVLGQDSEYRKNSHDESDFLDENAVGRARSNKGNKHGVKRSRNSDVIRGTDNGQRLKKQKIDGDLPVASST